MPTLEGFSVLPLGNVSPSASITKNGVTFNKATAEKLNSDYVLLLINEGTKQFAIQPCLPFQPQARPFLAAIKPGAPSVRWSSKELLRVIQHLTGWALDGKGGYKVPGEYNKATDAMIFDLNHATPIV